MWQLRLPHRLMIERSQTEVAEKWKTFGYHNFPWKQHIFTRTAFNSIQFFPHDVQAIRELQPTREVQLIGKVSLSWCICKSEQSFPQTSINIASKITSPSQFSSKIDAISAFTHNFIWLINSMRFKSEAFHSSAKIQVFLAAKTHEEILVNVLSVCMKYL